MRIAVTGIGIVSAAGLNVAENLATLRAGRSGIAPRPVRLATRHRLPVGEVPLSNEELAARLGIGELQSRTTLLGMMAAEEALRDAGGVRPRTALVSSTSVGGMDLTECFFEEFARDERRGRLRMAAHHDCADSTLAIARRCAVDGLTTTLSTACSSAANAIGLAARLLRHGVADRVVAGGCDALCRFTLNGFKSLMILDEQPCRPFDASRAGLNLGEGAAYVVLERAGETAHRPYCYVAGFANANDAYHQTASSPDGEGDYLAMSGALRQAGIEPRKVDWVNAHGTGTPNNDLAESRALRRLFGAELPPVSSTKATTGHTLAAAGAIEAVISVLALHHGECYPTLRFAEPDPEGGIRPLDCLTRSDLRCVLSNSFGFGGNCASLLLCREP